MPRKRKNEQSSKATTGQPYGQAGMQKTSQDQIPLPKMEDVPASTLRAGQMNFKGPSMKPQEDIMTPAAPIPQSNKISKERLFQIQAVLPALEERASQRDAPFQLRKLVREMNIVVSRNKDNRTDT